MYNINWDFNIGDQVKRLGTGLVGTVLSRGHLQPRTQQYTKSTSDTYTVDPNYMAAGIVAGCEVDFGTFVDLLAETALVPHP